MTCAAAGCYGQGSFFCSGVNDDRLINEKWETLGGLWQPSPVKKLKMKKSPDRKPLKTVLKIVLKMLRSGSSQMMDSGRAGVGEGLLGAWSYFNEYMYNKNWTLFVGGLLNGGRIYLGRREGECDQGAYYEKKEWVLISHIFSVLWPDICVLKADYSSSSVKTALEQESSGEERLNRKPSSVI